MEKNTTSYIDEAGGRFGAIEEKDLDVVPIVDSFEDLEEKPKEDKVVLTKEEFEALKAKTDSTEKLSQSFQSLAEKLVPRTPNVQQVAPAPMPALDPNELEREAFTSGGFASAVRKVAESMMSEALAPLAYETVQQQKRLLKLDPATSEYFTKYEADIEAKVQSLPPNMRTMPGIYEKAYQQVIFEKQQEIIQEKAAKLAEEAVKKALAEAGVQGQEGLPTRKVALYQESGTVSAATGASIAKQNSEIARITRDEAEEMRRLALDPEDNDQRWAYIRTIRARRTKR